MSNPYTPSSLTDFSDSTSPQKKFSHSAVLIASYALGMVVGLCISVAFFEWFHEGLVRLDIVARKVVRQLSRPSFSIPCFLAGFLLTMSWRHVRRRWRGPYRSTVTTRLVSGCVFVCAFFATGNLVKYPLFAAIGSGSVDLIIVPLALIAATLAAIELEAALCQPAAKGDEPVDAFGVPR
ncbi:hypothetical protein Rcae01_00054 [Novipirellula caenicola]|uniref:DUF2975 domain-containing protein n=1 Tax=Novipirellula caenicola TaxID=1536901 RepID=A0ABP9VHC9_9BACT